MLDATSGPIHTRENSLARGSASSVATCARKRTEVADGERILVGWTDGEKPFRYAWRGGSTPFLMGKRPNWVMDEEAGWQRRDAIRVQSDRKLDRVRQEHAYGVQVRPSSVVRQRC